MTLNCIDVVFEVPIIVGDHDEAGVLFFKPFVVPVST